MESLDAPRQMRLIGVSSLLMSTPDYREALRLIESAIALLERRRIYPLRVAQEIRRLALETDLLRARLRQAPVCSQRN